MNIASVVIAVVPGLQEFQSVQPESCKAFTSDPAAALWLIPLKGVGVVLGGKSPTYPQVVPSAKIVVISVSPQIKGNVWRTCVLKNDTIVKLQPVL